MDGISILERIVIEDGNCCWACSAVCKACPLGRLVKADGSRHVSCVEALNIESLSEKEADARYKEAALNKLADLLLEKAIQAD
jgi:epoxyqueuosine reductase QueG